MNGLLDELYQGGPCPEGEPVEDPEYQYVNRLYCKIREEWQGTLTEEQRELWEKLNDASEERSFYEGKQAFVTGFRMGLRVAAESLL